MPYSFQSALILLLPVVWLSLAGWSREVTDFVPRKVPAAQLPNLIQVHPRVYSGGLPIGDAAFAELQRLGIRTVISVDGMTPDTATAARYGLRYVHLPHGYDGIAEERVTELAQAYQELAGPIYVHCHHGKHRSPTAAAAGCIAAGMLPAQRAPEILQLAGTAAHYPGLHRTANQAKPHAADKLRQQRDWPAVATVSHTVRQMTLLDDLQERCTNLDKESWPATSAAREAATLLREAFTELLRDPQTGKQPTHYAALLQESETAALELETLLTDHPTTETPSKRVAWLSVKVRCTTCHRAYRDGESTGKL